MAKNRCKVTRKGRSVLKPQRSVRSKRSVQTFYARPKLHNHAQGIVHNRIARGHTAMFDTGSQKSMIGLDGWEIIKRHDSWIYTQGVNMGGLSKVGRRLKLVDARGVVKNRLDDK